MVAKKSVTYDESVKAYEGVKDSLIVEGERDKLTTAINENLKNADKAKQSLLDSESALKNARELTQSKADERVYFATTLSKLYSTRHPDEPKSSVGAGDKVTKKQLESQMIDVGDSFVKMVNSFVSMGVEMSAAIAAVKANIPSTLVNRESILSRLDSLATVK